MEEILKVASAELGVHEIEGDDHNPRIVQYAKESGFSWINDDETPWCSVFLNWVAKETGFVQSKSAAARSWLNVGFSVNNPEPGDIVVYWRDSPNSHKGHVGVFLGYSKDKTRIYTLGGNQRDSVSVSAYSVNQLLDFRRLVKAGKVKLSTKKLERGDKGQDVIKLQDALKMAGFNPGTSDGDYGPKTEAAVKDLQTTNSELEISGVFDSKTRKHLLSILNN